MPGTPLSEIELTVNERILEAQAEAIQAPQIVYLVLRVTIADNYPNQKLEYSVHRTRELANNHACRLLLSHPIFRSELIPSDVNVVHDRYGLIEELWICDDLGLGTLNDEGQRIINDRGHGRVNSQGDMFITFWDQRGFTKINIWVEPHGLDYTQFEYMPTE